MARGNRTKKLTARKVANIRAAWGAGESQRRIAQRYRISQAMVSLILDGKAWRQEHATWEATWPERPPTADEFRPQD